jgi:oligopeptide transport system permease protein
MTRFILGRILQFPLILAVIYLITFLLAWVAPGSPFGNDERPIDPLVKAQLQAQFHADHWYKFLGYYPLRLLHGDLGPSMFYLGWSVNDVMKAALPVSISLGLLGLTIAMIAGSGIGVLAAVRRGGIFDWLSLAAALVGISVPGFVAAGVLIVVFSDRLHWFPSAGWGSLRQMVLPGVAISLLPLAYIARLTRASMLDVLGSDFIRTARAKGLSRSHVIWRHAFSNALLPVFSYLGPAAAAAMTGSFVVEYIFNIPGLGQHFVRGVQNRDQTLILGTVMVYSALLMGLNLVVDVGYALVDPRIDVTAKA